MNPPRQLEYRALALLEALAAGRKLADADPNAAVFLRWPAPASFAARRLAAQANAARGRDALWLIGVGAHGKRPGGDLTKFEDWQAGVLPLFDGLAPRITAIGVSLAPAVGKRPATSLAALHIETSRTPFVVRTGALEVPWLDTDTGLVRPCGRLELVKLLTPLQEVPQLEILEADLTFYKNPHSAYSKTTFRWTLDGALYFVPRGDDRIVFPLQRCRASLSGVNGGFTAPTADCNFTADKNSPSVRLTESAILLDGLGRIFIYCAGSTNERVLPLQQSLSFALDLVPTGSDRAATALTTMRPAQVTEGNQAGRWKL